MASPDLDNGYLRLAHELFAAVCCAGFSKWEMVVLREVFDQIYGPRKARTATLPLSDIAGRAGTYKQTIYRAVQSLVDAGVIAKNAEGAIRFIKDYESWRQGDSPRFSPSEIAYCAAAKRIKPSNLVVNNGAYHASAPALTASAPALTERKRTRLPASAPALTEVSAGAYPESVPPTPPSCEPARQREWEKKEEGGKNAPDPPLRPSPIPDDPVAKQCLQLAMDRWGASNGDALVGDLLRTFKPPIVRHAIDREWDKHGANLKPSYLRSICQEVQAEGIPVRKGENTGKTAVQQRPEETRSALKRPDFEGMPDTPATRAVRAMWDGTNGATHERRNRSVEE